MRRSWEEELEGYFAGRLEGAMGLRSWLGRWQDHGPTRGGSSGATPPEPGGAALAAARDTNRVEGALALCGERHARVLQARYTPRGPHAALQSYGEMAGVLLVLGPDASCELEARMECGVRRALRTGTAEKARELLEEMHGIDDFDLFARLEAIERASVSALRRDQARRARQVRAHLRQFAGLAVGRAVEAYIEARDRWGRLQRAQRLDRYRASLEGR